MIDVKSLPMNINGYSRSDPESRSFTNKGSAHGYSISKDLKTLVFGTWRPVGAVLKKVSVETNEDVVTCIEKGIVAYISQKKNATS